MADGTHSKVKLNVRVPPDKKQEWQDSLEEEETLSTLVRRAVDHEIRDEYLPKDALEDVVSTTDQADLDLSGVVNRMDELQQTVEAFEDKLDTLSTADTATGEEDLEELAMDLLPRLPSYPSDIPEHALQDMGGTGGKDPQEYIKFIIPASRQDSNFPNINGAAQRLAREIREPTPKVREALIHLESNTTEDVHSAIVDGTRHWMRGL